MSWNALQFLIDYNIPLFTDGNNVQQGWVNITCPLCGDHSSHGGFNPYAGYYHCWRCGGHSLSYIVTRLLGTDPQQTNSIILEYEGSTLIRTKKKIKVAQAKKIELPGAELKNVHKRFLEGRYFDPEFLQEKYGLTGTTFKAKGSWKFRIIIPFIYNRELVTYQGRDYTDKQKEKYKTLEVEESVLNYNDYFYNIDNAKENKCCIVEGAFDVFRMGDGFVSPFGTFITDNQIRFITERYEKIFVMFDPEKEAQKKARKLAIRIASFGIDAEVIDIEGDVDPGDLTRKEAYYIRKELGF